MGWFSPRIRRSLLTVGAMATMLAGCAKTVYIREPAVCPRDIECLALDPSIPSDEVTRREAAFVQNAVASTVEVHGIRFNNAAGEKSVSVGVGAVIGTKGYVLTSYHVVARAEMITVQLHYPTANGHYAAGPELAAYPLVSADKADVTLLVLSKDAKMPPPMVIRRGHVIKDDPVWFLGAHGPLASGRVMDTNVNDNGLQLSADVNLVTKHEDDGAPVLNACGEIVGVHLGPYGPNGRLRFLPIEDALDKLQITRSDLR